MKAALILKEILVGFVKPTPQLEEKLLKGWRKCMCFLKKICRALLKLPGMILSNEQ
jgi:hypothetical protein